MGVSTRFCSIPECNRLANVYAIDRVEYRGWADFYCRTHIPLGFEVVETIRISGLTPLKGKS